ncbi:hypothetical protein AB0B63_07350 [Micromonospora sp. NPDC049081]|uniref:hypothetical protein n=1 Tax=Micromonospora sp. NPDC049081 TaxID=3155150 RepID=UPI003402221A
MTDPTAQPGVVRSQGGLVTESGGHLYHWLPDHDYGGDSEPMRSTAQHVEGHLLPRYRWARMARLGCCRTGLHFLAWSDQGDAFMCACKRIILGGEDVR